MVVVIGMAVILVVFGVVLYVVLKMLLGELGKTNTEALEKVGEIVERSLEATLGRREEEREEGPEMIIDGIDDDIADVEYGDDPTDWSIPGTRPGAIGIRPGESPIEGMGAFFGDIGDAEELSDEGF